MAKGSARLVWVVLFLAWSCFGQQSQPSAPAFSDQANLPLQKIGANDLLGVTVYDAPDLTRTVRVSADGRIMLPFLKQRVLVTGLFPDEVGAAIAKALRDEQLMVDPFVTVSVVQYRSRPIRVVGAVKKAITFQALGETTLLDAISMAEGLSEDAGPEVLISKKQLGPDGNPMVLTQRVNVASLFDSAESESNLPLTGGEEVRVPEAGRIYVVGNVKKPGSFPLRDNSETSVLKMLALCEGTLPFYSKQAFIYRREAGGGKNEIPIELANILARKTPDVPLLPNDVLYIPDRSGRRNVVGALEKSLPAAAGIGAALIWMLR